MKFRCFTLAFSMISCFSYSQIDSMGSSLANPAVSNSVRIKVISVYGVSNSLRVSTRTEPELLEATPSTTHVKQKRGQLEVDEAKISVNSTTDVTRELGVNKYPNYYALLIGNSDYTFSNQSLTDLENPIKDVESLGKTLTRYSFDPNNIVVLRNATRFQIIDALEELATRISDKDNLLIFYAGHGYWDEQLKVGYWLPADAIANRKASWLSNSNLKDYVAGINSKHTILISDACFSGSIFKAREVVADPISEFGVAQLYKYPSRKAMTSGNMNTTPDESRFFQYLNKRLMENEAKFISARELFHNLFNAVINNTRSIPQYGVIQDTGDEGGEFIFIKK